jgi:hypothetical protein
MENIDLVGLILQVVAYWFFYKLGQASIIKAISKDLLESLKAKGIDVGRDAEGNIEFKQNLEQTVIEIERVESQYFAYSDQGEFMGQGGDFKILFEGLKKRFPDKNFRIDKDQKNLTEQEVGEMIRTIFEVFGERAQKNAGS